MGAYVVSGPLEAIFRRKRVEVVPDEDLLGSEEEPVEEQGPRY